MPEEQDATPQVEDTSQVEPAPQEDTAAEETNVVDYRSRYDNLRPEFDRRSQRLKEYEDRFGELEAPPEPQYDDEDVEDDGEFYTPEDLNRHIDQRVEARLTQRERQLAEQQGEVAFINSEIATLEKELGDEFSDKEWNELGHNAERFRDENGRPDIRRAYEHFNELIDGRLQKRIGKKSGAGRPASGASAAEVVDLDDSNARAEFIDRVMAQNVDPDD